MNELSIINIKDILFIDSIDVANVTDNRHLSPSRVLGVVA